MKSKISLILSASLTLSAALSQAQTTSAVPAFISYQGRVVGADGIDVGATTPQNRTVTFRIWNSPTASGEANLIYSEQQTVTISKGEFSVLMGQGNNTAGSPLGFSENNKGPKSSPAVNLADVFNGTMRYLGVTVDDGTAAVDNEISPRQQIVSTAFAFRAKYAETLGTATNNSLSVSDNGNVGIGAGSGPYPARLTLAGTSTGTNAPQLVITDAADPTERLRIGVDNTGNGSGFIQAFKEGTGPQNLLLNASGGNVGIGTDNPTSKFTVHSGVNDWPKTSGGPGDQTAAALRLRGAGNPVLDLGSFGTNGAWLQSTNQNDLSQRYPLYLNPNGGSVGVGTNNATAKFTVHSGVNDWPKTSGNDQTAAALRVRGGNNAVLDLGLNGANGAWLQSTDQLGLGLNYPLFFNPNGGNVGIGVTGASRARLQVAGPIASTVSGTFDAWVGSVALVASPASPWSGKTIFGGDGSSWRYSIASKNGTAAEVDHLVVTDQGRVGIGTIAPTAKLDVAGDIKSNGKSVAVGEESLRMLQGWIPFMTSGGSSHVGFTITWVSLGKYRVNFTTPFQGAPTVSATPYSHGRVTSVIDPTAPFTGSAVTMAFYDNSGNLTNVSFTFSAIGVR
jgi:hypothetical protein